MKPSPRFAFAFSRGVLRGRPAPDELAGRSAASKAPAGRSAASKALAGRFMATIAPTMALDPKLQCINHQPLPNSEYSETSSKQDSAEAKSK